jgi:hypothetical protein
VINNPLQRESFSARLKFTSQKTGSAIPAVVPAILAFDLSRCQGSMRGVPNVWLTTQCYFCQELKTSGIEDWDHLASRNQAEPADLFSACLHAVYDTMITFCYVESGQVTGSPLGCLLIDLDLACRAIHVAARFGPGLARDSQEIVRASTLCRIVV